MKKKLERAISIHYKKFDVYIDTEFGSHNSNITIHLNCENNEMFTLQKRREISCICYRRLVVELRP